MYLVLYDPARELVYDPAMARFENDERLAQAIADAGLDIFSDDQYLLVGHYNPHVGGYVQIFERDEDFFCPDCGGESYGYGYCFCPACHISALNESLAQQGSKMRFEWRGRI